MAILALNLQVDALTSMVTNTTEGALTTDELTQVLKDGVLEVTSKWLQIKPNETFRFQCEHAESTTQGAITQAEVTRVLRETGTDEDWRACKQIDPGMQSKVTDIESMDYASKYNPVYYIDNNNSINVLPVPGASNNAYKVYYINDSPQRDDGTALVASDVTIKFFPKFLISLVVKYAALKSIEAKIASYAVDEEDQELVAAYNQTHKHLVDEYDAFFNETKVAEKAKTEKLQQLFNQAGGGAR